MTKLTKRRLNAILEALSMRLAGAIDDDDLDVRDYLAALDWANEELNRRFARSKTLETNHGLPKDREG